MSDSVPAKTCEPVCSREDGAGDTKATLETELLLLPNGSLLVHNLTPTFAAMLAELGLEDACGRVRAPGEQSAAPTSAVATPGCDP